MEGRLFVRFAILACAFLLLAPSAPRERYLVVWGMEANEFPANGEGRDFLAVFDVGSDFGKLVAFVPAQKNAVMAHHTNEGMPPDHLLFASDFMTSQGDVFDLTDPSRPFIAGSFGATQGYTHAHSFAALSNGHTLATYQVKGPDDDQPGALVELDQHGRIVRASDSSAPSFDTNVRPYGLLVLESIDRVVTTSAPMPAIKLKAPTHVIQIWRLSDLKLLQTVDLNPSEYGASADSADDATLLNDGKTVMVKTGHCGLFTLTDVASPHPRLEFVYDFGARLCSGVPVVSGHYWVEALYSAHAIAVLDVKDPAHPTEVSHLYLGAGARPHWLSLEPGTGTIVVTGYGSLINKISFASIDPATGGLTLDPRTIDMKHSTLPDGWSGAAIPHAAIFYR